MEIANGHSRKACIVHGNQKAFLATCMLIWAPSLYYLATSQVFLGLLVHCTKTNIPHCFHKQRQGMTVRRKHNQGKQTNVACLSKNVVFTITRRV